MSYIKAFTEKIAGLSSNLDTYNQKLPEYQKRIPHQLLGGIIESAFGAFEFAHKNSAGLVAHLKVEEAFANHGLGENETATIKLLHAAILKNPEQFTNAFDRHIKTSNDKIYELTQNIAHAKVVTDMALKYAEILLNADWKPGAEIPADEGPKWVWLTDGYFTYLEKEAKYNLKENQWEIKRITSLPSFEIHYWTDVADS